MKQKTPGAVIHVAGGQGQPVALVDHRFGPDQWQHTLDVDSADAHRLMAHLLAEASARGGTTAGLTQLGATETSGALTLGVPALPAAAAFTIEIAWEKPRDGRLRLQARPADLTVASRQFCDEFFGALRDRLRDNPVDRGYRRFWLVYDGLPWSGELWLEPDLRLGPPSRFPSAQLGRQVVIVDALIEGIGQTGVTINFHNRLRELRLVLSPILGIDLQTQRQWDSEWVPQMNDRHELTDCQLHPVGYTELDNPSRMPTAGTAPTVVFEDVGRPGLGRYGIGADDTGVRIPKDLPALWKAFRQLSQDQRTQFLNACNAYSIAQSLWPDQRTAYSAFLVVACEALKPAGSRFDNARIYDVVASLIDLATAEALKQLKRAPQTVRSKHLHRGVLASEDLTGLMASDPFQDPSFDQMLTMLAQVTQICLIEWLRRGGRYSLVWARPPRLPATTTGARSKVARRGRKRP